MKILILNWRDIKHPAAGGAEILTHELAQRWIKKGHVVVQFSSMFDGAKHEENMDGVKIIRGGHSDARYLFWSVHFQAFWKYLRNFREKFDLILDQIHGIPFFTPLYVKERKIAFICEVADELWGKMYGPFFGSLGRLIEIMYLKLVYRNMHFLTISESTKKDLLVNGIREGNIHIIPMGIRLPKVYKTFPKQNNATLIYVGRLSKTKGIEDAFFVLKNVKTRIPKAKLWIVGRGENKYYGRLINLVEELDIKDSVEFFGFVTEEKKFELMARAHLLIAPSVKEGFGLTIPEAGFVGTPAIGYNVLGLRDVLLNEKNLLLVEPDIDDMSKAVINLLENKYLYQDMKKKSKKHAEQLSLEKSSEISLQLLTHHATF